MVWPVMIETFTAAARFGVAGLRTGGQSEDYQTVAEPSPQRPFGSRMLAPSNGRQVPCLRAEMPHKRLQLHHFALRNCPTKHCSELSAMSAILHGSLSQQTPS